MSAVLASASLVEAAPCEGPRALRVLNVLEPEPERGNPLPASGEALERLMALRDDLARASVQGRFADAASREWRLLPRAWREDLLTLAGLGADMDALQSMAGRDWYEIPPPSRVRISGVVRSAKTYLPKLVALAARG